jgi:hypothetical protein
MGVEGREREGRRERERQRETEREMHFLLLVWRVNLKRNVSYMVL